MRALETGRSMLRATNTGMTAAIGRDGSRARSACRSSRADALDVEVHGYSGATPYVRFGDCAGAVPCSRCSRWRVVALRGGASR